jgi:hypothetical protein
MQKDPRDTIDISFQYYLQRAANEPANDKHNASMNTCGPLQRCLASRIKTTTSPSCGAAVVQSFGLRSARDDGGTSAI